MTNFKVKIVSITNPLENVINEDGSTSPMSAEQFVAFTARVSNENNQYNAKTMPKLLKYLQSHKHWSPFEMAHVCFEIETSRAIAPQILRHRSFSYQEFSARYSETPEEPMIYELRRQDIKNKQNSIDDMTDEDKAEFLNDQAELWANAHSKYKKWLDKGAAKEVARFLLPQVAKTRLYMVGSLRSWITYCQVRCDPATQLEHRQIADAIKAELSKHFPSSFE